jgi:Holliday junction resolvasome RuvABC DNA-binding subunit
VAGRKQAVVVRQSRKLHWGFESIPLPPASQHKRCRPETLNRRRAKGDVERIDALPGVGPKVAERVVRELRDRVGDLKLVAPSTTQINGPTRAAPPGNQIPAGSLDEAISALVNLGMKPVEANGIVQAVVAEDSSAAESSEVIIRRSLAVLRGEK